MSARQDETTPDYEEAGQNQGAGAAGMERVPGTHDPSRRSKQ